MTRAPTSPPARRRAGLRWRAPRAGAALLGLGLLAAAAGLPPGATPAAEAASYDPSLIWRTLQTEHFNITFHQGEERLAEELAAHAEQIWDVLTADMDNAPRRRTEIVLVDHTDVANGYAMTLPINTIVIFVTAPQENSVLGLYEDWLHAITTHEFAHILHLDTVEGLPRLLRYALGRIVSTNQLSPWWIVEGQATYQETRFTTGGRGRSTYARMILRMATLEDSFPALGQLDGLGTEPPGGNIRYLFGQSFLQYIADHSSEDAWTRWNHTYGAWVPYWLPARRVFGDSFRSLYDDWKAQLEVEFTAERDAVIARGLTIPTILSDGDDSCSGPTFSPDGERLVWSCSDPRIGSNVYLADAWGGEAKIEIERVGAKDFTWRPDSQAFAYAAVKNQGLYSAWYDVMFHQVGAEGSQALTGGKRARDPAFSPDGSDLLVIRNKAQDNNLYRMRIDQSLEALTGYDDHTQLSTPRFSPDGRFVAMSVWTDGLRDLWIYTSDGQPYRRVTADSHIDRDPAWSADGRYLFFSSDRTGIANIYAVDLETERLWQVTEVLGGAFQPSIHPDFTHLVFQSYAAHGFDVAMLPLDPSSWRDRGSLAAPILYRGPLAPIASGAPVDAGDWTPIVADAGDEGAAEEPAGAEVADGDDAPDAGADGARAGEADGDAAGDPDPEPPPAWKFWSQPAPPPYDFTHPVEPYAPLRSLLPPRYLAPALYATSLGYLGAISTGGVDTLRRYAYSANVTYRTDADFVGGGGGFTWNRWDTILSASASTFVSPYGDVYVDSGSRPGVNAPGIESYNERYWDRRVRGWVAATHPLSTTRSVFGRYTGLYRTSLDPLPDEAYLPFLPSRGFFSSISGGWRYARGRSYSHSVSLEDDSRILSVVGEWTSSLMGSYTYDDAGAQVPFDRLLLTAEVREYLTAPWGYNHAIALRAAGGASFGDQLNYGSFRLGGAFGETAYYALPDEFRSLRGFRFGADAGNWYYLGNVEYRFPLWRLNWGAGTLPAFLRYLHGAAFIDLGDAFDDPAEIGAGPLIGAGAELRLSMVLGWATGMTGRLGYAFGVRGGGYSPLSADALYLQLGTSF